MITPVQMTVVRNTRARLALAVRVPADNWERQAGALVLADFDDAVQRADADLFADPQAVGHVCAAWDAAVCR